MFQRCFMSVVFAAILLGISSGGIADTYVSDKDDSVRRNGIAYNIAEDRKVENIAGVYEPEGLDKYLKRYIDKLSAKVDELSGKIDKLSEQVVQLGGKIDSSATKKDAVTSSSQAKLI